MFHSVVHLSSLLLVSAILSEAPEIPGLDGRKMSKSYGNSIMLGATAEETAKLIKKSPTDSERRITFDPVAARQSPPC